MYEHTPPCQFLLKVPVNLSLLSFYLSLRVKPQFVFAKITTYNEHFNANHIHTLISLSIFRIFLKHLALPFFSISLILFSPFIRFLSRFMKPEVVLSLSDYYISKEIQQTFLKQSTVKVIRVQPAKMLFLHSWHCPSRQSSLLSAIQWWSQVYHGNFCVAIDSRDCWIESCVRQTTKSNTS